MGFYPGRNYIGKVAQRAFVLKSLKEMQFKFDQCNFSLKLKRGLEVHIGKSHKDIQIHGGLRGLPERLRAETEQGGRLIAGKS